MLLHGSAQLFLSIHAAVQLRARSQSVGSGRAVVLATAPSLRETKIRPLRLCAQVRRQREVETRKGRRRRLWVRLTCGACADILNLGNHRLARTTWWSRGDSNEPECRGDKRKGKRRSWRVGGSLRAPRELEARGSRRPAVPRPRRNAFGADVGDGMAAPYNACGDDPVAPARLRA